MPVKYRLTKHEKDLENKIEQTRLELKFQTGEIDLFQLLCKSNENSGIMKRK